MSLAERRARLEAAEAALDGLDAVLYEASGAELGEWMSLADRVAAKAAAARVAVTVEATARGEVAGSGTNVHGWVREHAPSLRQGGAGAVASVVAAVVPSSGTRPPAATTGTSSGYAERAAHDPPTLTPQRLRDLLAVASGDDVDEQRWAEYELSEAARAWEDEQREDDITDEVWDEIVTELEAAS